MISTTSGNSNIKTAVSIVNGLFKDGTIKNLILNHPPFDFTNQSNQAIAEIVQSFWATKDFQISTYRPWWRWSKAIASTGDQTGCAINIYKLSSYIPDLCDTIAHEFIHGANFYANPNMNPKNAIFGHGDNSPVGKDNSTPYYIGDAVYKLIEPKYP